MVMLETSDEILQDVDDTLDRLIENAKVLEDIGEDPLFSTERDALAKTQESLLAHLVNMEPILEKETPKRRRKRKEVVEKIKSVKRRAHKESVNYVQSLGAFQ